MFNNCSTQFPVGTFEFVRMSNFKIYKIINKIKIIKYKLKLEMEI